MNILIAGGCGFVGTNLALYFREIGHNVICVDNLSRKGSEYNYQRLTKNKLDVRVFDLSKEFDICIPKIDVILNCAAQSSATKGVSAPLKDYKDNLTTVVRLLELARKDDSLFFQWSTNKVYSSTAVNTIGYNHTETRFETVRKVQLSNSEVKGPRSIYGATKLCAETLIEEYAALYGIRCVINRFSCLAGKYQMGCADQGWFALWMMAHVLGWPLQYIGWGGKQVRDILDVNDVCTLIDKQILSLLRSPKCTCWCYNVGGGSERTVSLLEATAMCQQITGNTVPIETIKEERWADHRVYISEIGSVCKNFDWCPTTVPSVLFEDIYHWVLEERENLSLLNPMKKH